MYHVFFKFIHFLYIFQTHFKNIKSKEHLIDIHFASVFFLFMYFSLLRYIFIWDACGFYFTDVVCGFSPGREKFCHFLEIGACRVGVSISLCVGLCLVGPLLVGHSFRWRFLIGMGGGVVVRCLSVCIICAFLRGSATWGCCFGYPFISAE